MYKYIGTDTNLQFLDSMCMGRCSSSSKGWKGKYCTVDSHSETKQWLPSLFDTDKTLPTKVDLGEKLVAD